MVNKEETQKFLESFFNECYKYWLRNGYSKKEAFKLALEDVRAVKHNPFVPNGEELDVDAKNEFIHYREMDLGGNK